MHPAKQSLHGFDCDALLSSIAKILVAIVSFAVLYGYLALEQRNRHAALSNLVGLDKLLAAREVALRAEPGSLQMTKRDLIEFFPEAAKQAHKPKSDGTDPHTVETIEERGFTDEPIPGSVIVSVMSRLSQRYCKAAVITLKAGDKFNLATMQIVGKTYWINSEDVSLVAFDSCLRSSHGSFQILVLKDKRDVIIAFPQFIEREFRPIAPPAPFSSFKFYDYDKLASLIPGPIAQFAAINRTLVTVHIHAIEHYILSHATSRQGRFYAPFELDIAVSGLYQEQEKPASIIGINAPISKIIDWGPFVFLILSFELWRRVRHLPTDLKKSRSFSFITDTTDLIGKVASRTYAFLPLICAFIIYYAYIASTGARFISADDLWRGMWMLRKGYPPDDILTWVSISMTATLLLLLVPVQILIVFDTTKRLLSVAKVDRSEATPRLKMTVWRIFRLRKAGR